MKLDWITPRQAAEQWGLTERHVQFLCKNCKIADVVKVGRSWLIPKDAHRPLDGRRKTAKLTKSVTDGGNTDGEERS